MPFKVCYSFWALSALSILQHLNWIDSDKLIKFILSAQDEQGGGIADRPGDMVDVFHTLFGLAGEHDVEYPYFSISLSAAGLSLVGFPGLTIWTPYTVCLCTSSRREGCESNGKPYPDEHSTGRVDTYHDHTKLS